MNPMATALAGKIESWLIPGMPLIVGLCGTQASGKSTACAQLAEHFTGQGLRVGTLSLDDLYLGRTVRAGLAEQVHPLFATRGPPGTHDTAIGIATLDAVKAGRPVMLPRFDKRADEPLSSREWPLLETNKTNAMPTLHQHSWEAADVSLSSLYGRYSSGAIARDCPATARGARAHEPARVARRGHAPARDSAGAGGAAAAAARVLQS